MRRAGLLVLALILLPLGYADAASPLVNINTATVVELDTLPGIGPSKAAAIIDYRSTNGPFKKIEDIQNVKGIGPATFADMKSLITVGAVTQQATETSEVQPISDPVRSIQRQTVKPAITSQPTEVHEDAVIAPTATPTVAAVGAALPAQEETLPTPKRSSSDLFHSPWTFGLLGVIIVAGAIFILL
jgi:competence protein ComEA